MQLTYIYDITTWYIPMNHFVPSPCSGIDVDWKNMGSNFFCSSLFQSFKVPNFERHLITFLFDLNGNCLSWFRRGFDFLGHRCFVRFFSRGFRKESHGDNGTSAFKCGEFLTAESALTESKPSFNHLLAHDGGLATKDSARNKS